MLNVDLERLLAIAARFGALSGNVGGVAPAGISQKETSLTLSTIAPLYGCCSLFQPSGNNDLLSLTLEQEPFLDWLGWKPNADCRQFVKCLSYVGPDGTAAGSPSSGVAAACADANSVEWGACEYLLPDKGRIKRASPTRDITENNRRLWAERPLFTKDGQQISDELMWSIAMAGITTRQDLKRLVITGNHANANEFAGLQTLVNTGYRDVNNGRRCYAMDSYVLDWGSQPMTYEPNGTHALVDYLIAYIRRILQRANWSNMGEVAAGDLILQMPTFLRDCLLDTFTCWSVCPGSTQLDSYEARTYRNSLNGGMFGHGQIFVDGRPIPIICYDWVDFGQAAPYFTGDIWILTRRIGNVPVLWGQYIPMNDPAAAFQREAGYAHYKAVDDGRFLVYWKTDNECAQATLVLRPNLYLAAPWAQARIQNVACQRPLDPLSPDPTSSYYPETNLATASCPEDYLLTSPSS